MSDPENSGGTPSLRSASVWAACMRGTLVLAMGAAACHGADVPLHAPPEPVAKQPTHNPPAGPPSIAQCEVLWARYHAMAPGDPYVAHDSFVARCNRSEPAVVGCPERARAKVVEIVRASGPETDAGPGEPHESTLIEMLSRIALPTHHGICMARERLRFALRTGELEALGREATSGGLHPGEHGVVVVQGSYATLATTGVVESAHAADLGPAGEIRVIRQPDGTAWIYFLGGLLGRHQNQVGFLYATAAFGKKDFSAGEGGREQVCLERSEPSGSSHGMPSRYMLSCFSVVEHLSPQLIEVGSAPD